MNIRCSNRCANPVRPGDSSFDPTWYHTSTATRGLERSTWKITGSPFSRTNVSNGIVSMGGSKEPASWHESVRARRLNLRNPQAAAGMLALLVALPVALAAGPARANGALPSSYGILLPADKLQQVVLATNFGMIISEDGGTSWRWTCEQPETSFGYLYGVGPAPRDRFYALSPEKGLAISDDGSCSWQRAGGALASAVASDFFVDRANPDRVLAVGATVDPDGGDIGPPSLFESADAGATFGAAPLYSAPAGANIVSVEIARSNPMVVYVAIYRTPNRHPRLLRSSDGGPPGRGIDGEGAGAGRNGVA